MTSFPDSWSTSATGNPGYFLPGAQDLFLLPATPGVAHVLTGVFASLVIEPGASAYVPALYVFIDGAYAHGLFLFGSYSAPALLTPSWTGKIATPSGKSLDIRLSGALPTNVIMGLTVEGYAI